MNGRGSDNNHGRSQKYIGTPNGVVFCVDQSFSLGFLDGRVYHAYREDPIRIGNLNQLLANLEKLFDDLMYPWPGTKLREFRETPEPTEHVDIHHRILTDEELLQKQGSLATFIIRVQQRHDSTWQGHVTWVEADRTKEFASVAGLVHLIDEAIFKDENVSW